MSQAHVPDVNTDQAAVFAALGDDTRLQLVARLSSEPRASIASLTAGTGVSRQAVTKHLEVLRDAGLVRSDRLGREKLWQLERRQFDAARAYLDVVSSRWDEALARLKARAEAPE